MHVKFGAATLSILAVVLALGIVVGSTSGTAAASDSRLRLEGDLNAAASLTSGDAKFEHRSDRTRFSAEVEDTSIACGELHVFHVASSTTALGAMTADGVGVCDLNLDTRDGDSVPGMSASDIIEVRQGTTVVVSGSLMPK